MNTHKTTSRPPLTFATLAFSAAGLISPQLTAATIINLVNPSFENASGYNEGTTPSAQLLGWSTSQESYGSTFNAVANFTSGLSGNNVTRANGRFFQTSSVTYVAGETYTVTVDVGRSSDLPAVPNDSGFTVGFKKDSGNDFRSGGGLFVSGTTINTIADKTFQTFTATFVATILDAGLPVIVGLDDYYQGTTYVVDNFTLTTTAIPEPSIGLMGAAALGLMVRRRRC